jgi:hypothetical protein
MNLTNGCSAGYIKCQDVLGRCLTFVTSGSARAIRCKSSPHRTFHAAAGFPLLSLAQVTPLAFLWKSRPLKGTI